MDLESYSCVLCNGQVEETIEHLFLDCPFAFAAWQSINLTVNSGIQPLQNIELLKAQINQSFFMEIIILFSWAIWMSRNNCIFKGVPPSIQGCKRIFKSEFLWLLRRAKKKYFPKIQEWIDNFV